MHPERPSYWALLAGKIERNPVLLDTVLRTIDRWQAAKHRLDQTPMPESEVVTVYRRLESCR